MGAVLAVGLRFIFVELSKAIIGFIVKTAERLFYPKFWKKPIILIWLVELTRLLYQS